MASFGKEHLKNEMYTKYLLRATKCRKVSCTHIWPEKKAKGLSSMSMAASLSPQYMCTKKNEFIVHCYYTVFSKMQQLAADLWLRRRLSE